MWQVRPTVPALLILLSLIIAGCMNADNSDAPNGTLNLPGAAGDLEESCASDAVTSLSGGGGAVLWFQANGTTGEIEIAVRNISGDGESAVLVIEERPRNGSMASRFEAQKLILQAAYLHLPDGPGVVVVEGHESDPRAALTSRSADGTHRIAVPAEKEIGVTLQSFGSEPHIQMDISNAVVSSCRLYEGRPVEVLASGDSPAAFENGGLEHEENVDKRQYLVTHCAVRGGGNASLTGESISITVDSNPGQPFTSTYEFSASRASDQPIPYGICLHQQGVARAVNGTVDYDGQLHDYWIHSIWMLSMTADAVDVPLPDH